MPTCLQAVDAGLVREAGSQDSGPTTLQERLEWIMRDELEGLRLTEIEDTEEES